MPLKAEICDPKPYQLMPLRWSGSSSIHSLPLWLENRGLGAALLGCGSVSSSSVGSRSDRGALGAASAAVATARTICMSPKKAATPRFRILYTEVAPKCATEKWGPYQRGVLSAMARETRALRARRGGSPDWLAHANVKSSSTQRSHGYVSPSPGGDGMSNRSPL